MLIECKNISVDSGDVELVSDINNEAFPDDERIEISRMLKICELTDGEILGWYDDGKIIGFSVAHCNDDCVYLNYFAVVNSQRGKGYGHKLLKKIQDRYSDAQLILDFEILDPESDNYKTRCRRKAFYLDNGMGETGYYTKLYDNYFELVCNKGKLNVAATEGLLKKIHSAMPEFSEELYFSIEK